MCMHVFRYFGALTQRIEIRKTSSNRRNLTRVDSKEKGQLLSHLFPLVEALGCALEENMLVWRYLFSFTIW